MLFGWTITVIRSIGTSKSHRASMTSSPLLTRVALSIVIFAVTSNIFLYYLPESCCHECLYQKSFHAFADKKLRAGFPLRPAMFLSVDNLIQSIPIGGKVDMTLAPHFMGIVYLNVSTFEGAIHGKPEIFDLGPGKHREQIQHT